MERDYIRTFCGPSVFSHYSDCCLLAFRLSPEGHFSEGHSWLQFRPPRDCQDVKNYLSQYDENSVKSENDDAYLAYGEPDWTNRVASESDVTVRVYRRLRRLCELTERFARLTKLRDNTSDVLEKEKKSAEKEEPTLSGWLPPLVVKPDQQGWSRGDAGDVWVPYQIPIPKRRWGDTISACIQSNCNSLSGATRVGCIVQRCQRKRMQ